MSGRNLSVAESTITSEEFRTMLEEHRVPNSLEQAQAGVVMFGTMVRTAGGEVCLAFYQPVKENKTHIHFMPVGEKVPKRRKVVVRKATLQRYVDLIPAQVALDKMIENLEAARTRILKLADHIHNTNNPTTKEKQHQ